MKSLMLNIAGLICSIAIFSGSIAFAGANIQQVDAQSDIITTPPITNDYTQNDIGIADLLFNMQGGSQSDFQASSENSSLISSNISSENASSLEVSSAVPSSSKPVSSKPVPSKPSSNKPSSEVSSEIEEVSSEESQTPSETNPAYSEFLEIISGAVQREMVGTNTVPSPKYYEAYKAQAVACHSYMVYQKNRTGAYPTMAYSTPHSTTRQLVASVLDKLIYSNGQVINASFHAASGGHTQSSAYIWGGSLPYLQAVESKYDDYDSSFTISIAQVQSKLMAYGINVSGDATTWFDLSNASLSDGGFVDTINICGYTITGRKLRENIFGAGNLKSCKITSISVVGENIVFSTKGYGHGAGMSQLGALGYSANEGYSYIQILNHYYTGVVVS